MKLRAGLYLLIIMTGSPYMTCIQFISHVCFKSTVWALYLKNIYSLLSMIIHNTVTCTHIYLTQNIHSPHSTIVWPMISSIHILLNYSIFIDTSGFKWCPLKIMIFFSSFLRWNAPICLSGFNSLLKMLYLRGFCIEADPVITLKNCVRYSEWRKDENIPNFKSPTEIYSLLEKFSKHSCKPID